MGSSSRRRRCRSVGETPTMVRTSELAFEGVCAPSVMDWPIGFFPAKYVSAKRWLTIASPADAGPDRGVL